MAEMMSEIVVVVVVGRGDDAQWKKPRTMLVWPGLNWNPNELFPGDELTRGGRAIRIIGVEISSLTGLLKKAGACWAVLLPEMTTLGFEDWDPAKCPKVPIMSESEGENLVPTLWEFKGVEGETDSRIPFAEHLFPDIIVHLTFFRGESLGGDWNPTMWESQVPIVWEHDGGNREPTMWQLKETPWKSVCDFYHDRWGKHRGELKAPTEATGERTTEILRNRPLLAPARFTCKPMGVGHSNWADEVIPPAKVIIINFADTVDFSFPGGLLAKTMGEFPVGGNDFDNLEKGFYRRGLGDGIPKYKQGFWETYSDKCAILVNPLFDVNVQGAFALGAYKTSDASSPVKDALLYVLVFVYVLGFTCALGGKLFRSSKMGAVGSGAAAMGFVLTMVLFLLK